MEKNQVLKALQEIGLVPVLRAESVDKAMALASAIAPASAIAFSTDSARNTGTSPISRNATNTAALSITCTPGAKAPIFCCSLQHG